MVWLLIAAAYAGYGVPVEGVPNPAEREVFVWTNTVRMDPAAFTAVYPCDFDEFKPGEKTPKPPVLWHDGLGEAARVHSLDMYTNDHFSHDSSDGTSFGDRVARYYSSGFVGENIAWGYPSPFDAVLKGWMCSTGHRANIMSPDWDELGTGVVQNYYTQDFGSRGISPLDQPLAMGTHVPVKPTDRVEYLVNVYTEAPPARVDVLLDGEALPMHLAWGQPQRGTWAVETTPGSDCNRYAFRAVLDDGTVVRFPELGSFGFGPCPYADVEAGWMSGPAGPPDFPGIEDTGVPHFGLDHEHDEDERIRIRDWNACGCTHGSVGGLGWASLLLLGLVARRRTGGRRDSTAP